MRDVWLFQKGDFFVGQFNLQGSHGILQVRDFCRADDGSSHRFLLQQPGERDLCRRPFLRWATLASRSTKARLVFRASGV
mgnify:CR=1 FL=1